MFTAKQYHTDRDTHYYYEDPATGKSRKRTMTVKQKKDTRIKLRNDLAKTYKYITEDTAFETDHGNVWIVKAWND